MAIDIIDSRERPKEVFSVLEQHLPYSLPVLRRLQFMSFPGGQTPDSHVLSTFGKELPTQDFAVAYLDFSRGPETEMWLYSSIENPVVDGNNTVCEEQILELLKHARDIESQIAQDRREWPGVVLIGTLHEKILGILEKHAMVKEKTYEHFKFIFKVENLPTATPLLDNELSYSTVKLSDIPLVLSRTHIPRKERTMKVCPSVTITTPAGTPVAWAFLATDGSLMSLHCEEEYRGRGLAKAVASKLFREHVTDFAQDGLAHADVGFENLQSQGVCKSLNGTVGWSVYWAWITLA